MAPYCILRAAARHGAAPGGVCPSIDPRHGRAVAARGHGVGVSLGVSPDVSWTGLAMPGHAVTSVLAALSIQRPALTTAHSEPAPPKHRLGSPEPREPPADPALRCRPACRPPRLVWR